MESKEFISVSQFAEVLGVSRIAVYKKIKKGQIKALKIGNRFVIPKKYVDDIMGKTLNNKRKRIIEEAVKKTFEEYGEVLKRLGST